MNQPEENAGQVNTPTPRLLLIFGLIAGVLIGATVAFFLSGGSDPRTAQTEDADRSEPPAPEEPLDLLVVPINRFAVPVIGPEDEIHGYMWVDLVFEVDGPVDQSYVAARLPEIRDAALRDLHGRTTTREDRPGALDFDLLKARLEAISDQIAGDRIIAVRVVNAQKAPS